MIDGCQDRWTGGIPVCVLSGTAGQHESNGCASRATALMKERDYISLGLACTQEQELTSTSSAEEKMECDNVVLSLGLGPPEKETSPADMTSHADQQVRVKITPDGAKFQHFWHQNFRVSLSKDSHPRMANWQAEASSQGGGKSYVMPNGVPPWSPVPGRFAVPVPKVSTIPAKRPFQEVSGERRPLPVSEVASAPSSAMQPSAGIYAWNYDAFNASSAGGGSWQQVHVNFEQAASSHFHGDNVNTAFGHGSRQLAAALPTTPSFKVPQAAASGSMAPPSNALVNVKGAGPSSSQEATDVSARPEPENDTNRNKAPVVGWPPVRSFRKNTLQAAQISNRMSAEDLQAKSMGGASTSNSVDALEHINGSSSRNAFFVKAKLDGVRICRKVDLKAYESYEGLKGALQEMFQGFVSDNAKLDLVNGKNYVVTHEDKDGDCLLVGDVPWHMFLESSVKSLRIMKSMDANGIGEKGSAKLKAESNGKPS